MHCAARVDTSHVPIIEYIYCGVHALQQIARLVRGVVPHAADAHQYHNCIVQAPDEYALRIALQQMNVSRTASMHAADEILLLTCNERASSPALSLHSRLP
jgi:hypothetical protein